MALFDQKGISLYPELMAELDATKRERIGRLGDERGPWPDWTQARVIDLTHMNRIVKKIIRAAGLRGELTCTSFRHDGVTKPGDADLTDAQIRAQGRLKSAKAQPK